MYYIFFIHSPVDSCSDWFHVLAVVNSAALDPGDGGLVAKSCLTLVTSWIVAC